MSAVSVARDADVDLGDVAARAALAQAARTVARRDVLDDRARVEIVDGDVADAAAGPAAPRRRPPRRALPRVDGDDLRRSGTVDTRCCWCR